MGAQGCSCFPSSFSRQKEKPQGGSSGLLLLLFPSSSSKERSPRVGARGCSCCPSSSSRQRERPQGGSSGLFLLLFPSWHLQENLWHLWHHLGMRGSLGVLFPSELCCPTASGTVEIHFLSEAVWIKVFSVCLGGWQGPRRALIHLSGGHQFTFLGALIHLSVTGAGSHSRCAPSQPQSLFCHPKKKLGPAQEWQKEKNSAFGRVTAGSE